MPKKWKGGESGTGLRFGIVVSEFNRGVTARLLAGALGALKAQGTASNDIEIAWVPGAFEIPAVAKKIGLLGRFHAVICLGAVIEGETPHFHYICAETSRGIGQVALELGLPVIFGVLTTRSVDQAMERSGNQVNRGAEAALAAIRMSHLYQNLK